MIVFIIRRLLWMIPVLFVVALITFGLMHIAPGGPWDKEKTVHPATQAALNVRFGLDKPLWFNPQAASAASEQGLDAQVKGFFDSQFWTYIFGAAQGNLGPSYSEEGREVEDILVQRFPQSAKLGLVAIIFAIVMGIPLGILSALKQNTIFDYFAMLIATIGVSVPSFVSGILLILLFSRLFGRSVYTKPEQWGGIQAYLLPGFVLGLGVMSYITRLTRASMLEVKRQDYVRTAQAKGLSSQVVIFRHMLRNSLIPVVTILGPAVASLVTSSFVTEDVFQVPGMGNEFVKSIAGRDYSMIMGSTLFYAVLVAVGNLTVDMSYGFLDPRIRAHD
jgi:oligopeptide transport system permease protein